MKQCPTCHRDYTDDTLAYCLEDGSALIAGYDPQATLIIPEARPTNVPSAQSAPPVYSMPPATAAPTKSRAPIYILGAVVLLVLGIGVIALGIFGYSQMQASSSTRESNENKSQPSPGSWSTATPSAQSLVGVWRTNVYESGQTTEITYEFLADGTSKMEFKSDHGNTGKDSGTWQYSDGTLFERFSNGSSGKGSIKWINNDEFEITIIDNGVPAYNGLKRRYRRV